MEAIVRNVRDISPADRAALERLVGHPLDEQQRVDIRILESKTPAPPMERTSPPANVPDSWNVYEGLSDDEIEQLDRAIRQRANLFRDFE